MLTLLRAARRPALAGLVAVGSTLLYGQSGFSPQEGEYSLTRGLLGDQTRPVLSVVGDRGYVVWQDASVDGNGLGVGARALNNSLSPIVAQTFRVNQTTAGDQENPQVCPLPGAGAIFVWQGGPQGDQDIFGRIIGADGVFLGPEFVVNSTVAGNQTEPKLSLLKDGSLVVVWTSDLQDGSLKGVYGQRVSAAGEKLGGEFQVNTTTPFNQRSATVAGLAGGDFVVAWIGEQQRYENSVDLFARRYQVDGSPLTGEVLVNNNTNLCANPVIAGAPDGGFALAWSSLSLGSLQESWDVLLASYQADGTPRGNPVRVNEFLTGPQYGPAMAIDGSTIMVVWTSSYQEGWREGIYGRFLTTEGEPQGPEFHVNTLAVSQQIQPTVVADGAGRFLAAWTSYVGGNASFEVLGQRYAKGAVLPTPEAPFVAALDSYSLLVSWPELAGYGGDVSYQVYVDGTGTPVTTSAGHHVIENLVPGTTHTARLAYVVAGQESTLSGAASGTTWGRDNNFDGLPDDWQIQHWGANSKDWPSPTADLDGDGARTVDEFLAGTDPRDGGSVLKLKMEPTIQGLLVSWQGVVGSVYQLQTSTELPHWSPLEGPRFAAEPQVSVVVPPAGTSTYYRVIRIR